MSAASHYIILMSLQNIVFDFYSILNFSGVFKLTLLWIFSFCPSAFFVFKQEQLERSRTLKVFQSRCSCSSHITIVDLYF